MKIEALNAFSDNYIWIFYESNNENFDCVDPGDDKAILSFAAREARYLKRILITHHHFDHMNGVQSLLKHFPDAAVYAPQDDRLPFKFKALGEKDRLSADHYQFEVWFTPGHTATHISYYEPHQKLLFCGDTLFSAGCGRIFDGSAAELLCSLQRYKALPEDTKVYCAHEYTSKNLEFALSIEPDNKIAKEYLQRIRSTPIECTLPSNIGLEKRINPFLRLDSDPIKAYAKRSGVNPEDTLAMFRLIRKEKDEF